MKTWTCDLNRSIDSDVQVFSDKFFYDFKWIIDRARLISNHNSHLTFVDNAKTPNLHSFLMMLIWKLYITLYTVKDFDSTGPIGRGKSEKSCPGKTVHKNWRYLFRWTNNWVRRRIYTGSICCDFGTTFQHDRIRIRLIYCILPLFEI